MTDETHRNQTIERAIEMLSKNNYPISIIKTQLHKANRTTKDDNIQLNTTQPVEVIRKGCLYVPETSEKISKILKSQLNNIELAHRPARQLKDTLFSKTKQKIPAMEKTHVVYKIPCKGCTNEKCDVCYIGQTKNQSNKRRKQHILGMQYDCTSGLVLHCIETGHSPDFDNMEIIDMERNWSKRLTLESLHIAANNTCNVQREKGNSSAVYISLVKQQTKINDKLKRNFSN